jgi:hypothetical protein
MDIVTVGQGSTVKTINQGNQKPLIPNESTQAIRFEIPTQPTFAVLGSILSILSLVFMSGLSMVLYLQLVNHPESKIATWALLPFIFTIFGGTLGWVYELGLLLAGTPISKEPQSIDCFYTKDPFLESGTGSCHHVLFCLRHGHP